VRVGLLSSSLASSLALLVSVVLGGCSASPNEEGGDARFAVAEVDGGECADMADAGSGTGWSDIYRDYFGPMGKASCAGNGQCHGNSTQPGAQASGYVCGPTAAECYSGITSASANLVTVGDTTDDPTTTALYAVLRKCSGGGTMPQSPATLMFTSVDMTRIAAWIKAGAPNN
jgi:hypothetical protein